MEKNKNNSFRIKLFLLSVCLLAPLSIRAGSDAEMEAQIGNFMRTNSNQRRSSVTYNSVLARIAREKAYDMGRRGYFDHESPDGLDHGDLLERAGYEIKGGGGSGECIAAGSETPFEAWNSWMNSSGHRSILLGLESNTYFGARIEYGIGHAYIPGSKWGHYWVAVVATPENGNDSIFFNSNTTPNRNRTSTTSACSGESTKYPHVIKAANGNLKPACGYVWASSGSDDFRVKLMPGLTRTADNSLLPADGYTWVNPNDPKDFRVTRDE